MGKWARRWNRTVTARLVDTHVGGHVDEIAEDLAGLAIGVAAHVLRETAIKSAGDDQQRHVEVYLQTDRRGQRDHVEEAHRIGDSVSMSLRCA